MTPEQQADYDYAMSQIRPRIQFASMPMIQLIGNIGLFTTSMQQAVKAARDFEEATVRAMILGAIPNCRCTIKNNWEGLKTDAKDSNSK